MDAVKFIQERNRMCKSFDKCSYGCPAWDGSCKLEIGTYLKCEADKEVKIVEEWSAAHPRKTRQSVVLDNYPCARIDSQSVLYACPADVYGDNVCPKKKDAAPITCYECRREFWMQEVE